MEVAPTSDVTTETILDDNSSMDTGGDKGNSDNGEVKPEPVSKAAASNFVLPPRKRLKTSSTSLGPVYPGSSSSNSSCPSSPSSPPSSPSVLQPLSPASSTLATSFVMQEDKREEEAEKPASEQGNGYTDKPKQNNSPISQAKRQSKKRKNSKPLFEPSLFTPLPPRQAKVDSYKKSNNKRDKTSREAKTKAKPQKKRKLKHESSDSAEEEDETLYCLCKRPYDSDQFMIACDTCNDWFHVKCVNLTERKAKTLATYICPLCQETKRTEKLEEQKRKREEEKEQEHKREAKRQKKEQPQEASRVCANENCKAVAKPGSKYCSTKCGIIVAKQKLSEKQRTNQSEETSGEKDKRDNPVPELKVEKAEEEQLLTSKTLSVSESEDLKALRLLESQKTDTEVNLGLLKDKRLKLMEAIKFSTTLVAPSDASKPKKEDKPSNGGTMDIMDCFSCGQPIPGKNFARHMEQCYAKKEGSASGSAYKNDDQVTSDGTTLTYCNYYDSRSASYCTRLADICPFHSEKKKRKVKRNQLCGCPTTDFESGYCERLKRECGKHVNWENIRTEELDQELKRLTQLLSSVQEEIDIVKSRIKRRSMLDNSQHRTIEEN